ncbi:hypothetical protein SDC9_93887 [bioreactor metagenome]|uniref:Uncharacterized protein n=1 Tax=bioreactor metagenome TaxID=1076179 RepID=A0A645A1U9_9ZZZZ
MNCQKILFGFFDSVVKPFRLFNKKAACTPTHRGLACKVSLGRQHSARHILNSPINKKRRGNNPAPLYYYVLPIISVEDFEDVGEGVVLLRGDFLHAGLGALLGRRSL